MGKKSKKTKTKKKQSAASMLRPSSNLNHDDEDDVNDAKLFRWIEMDNEKCFGEVDRKRGPRMNDLEEKHRNYFWKHKGCKKGPPPTDSEKLEYRKDDVIFIRCRATEAAENRLKFMQKDEGAYLDEHWKSLESAADDILTYPYAWVEIIAPKKEYMERSLGAIRILLQYAGNLLTNIKYRNLSKALLVLKLNEKLLEGEYMEEQPSGLLNTMKDETGDKRFDLLIQEYRHVLYKCLAMAALGRRDEAIDYFRDAIEREKFYRVISFKQHQRLVNMDPHVSLLRTAVEKLGIPRKDLDEEVMDDDNVFGTLSDALSDKLDDDQSWRCIESFGIQGNTDSPMDYCYTCWMIRGNLKECGGCGEVIYCSKECQRKGWYEGCHKEECSMSCMPD